MPAGIFPTDVPGPMFSLGLSGETTLRTFRAQTGRVRRFGHTGAMLLRGTFSWDFTVEEYNAFELWRTTEQGDGEGAFTITLTTGATALPHVARFTGLPRYTRSSSGFSVKIPVVITSRPSGVSNTWHVTYDGPPALFPYTEIGSPEMRYSESIAQNFVATSGFPFSAAQNEAVGQDLSLAWVLSPTEFDYFVEWYRTCLRFGQTKFIATFGELGTLLFTITDDVAFTIDGVSFAATLKAQATVYDPTKAIDYVYNRAEDYAGIADRWINKAEDVTPDRIINQGQP